MKYTKCEEASINKTIQTDCSVNNKNYRLKIDIFTDNSVKVYPNNFLDDLLKYEIENITIYPDQFRSFKGYKMIILTIEDGRFRLKYYGEIKNYSLEQ